MGFVTSGVHSLIGGVSKQHPTKRFSSQCEEMINWDASPHDGLRRRSPSRHLALLGNGRSSPSDAVQHSISRDRSERYLVHVASRSSTDAVKVYDTSGTRYDVYAPGGGAADFSYLEQQNQDQLLDIDDAEGLARWSFGSTSEDAEITGVTGPLGFSAFYKLDVNPDVGSTDVGLYYLALTGLDITTPKSLSCFVTKNADRQVVDGEDTNAALRLVLVEDSGGTPVDYFATFDWDSTTGALYVSASHSDVDADVEDLGDGMYRARMIYTPNGAAAEPDQVKIELPYSGPANGSTEYSVLAAQVMVTESEDLQLTAPYFPDYTVGTTKENVRLLTIADFTFISNGAITVEKDSAVSEPQNQKDRDGALVFFRQMSYNTEYSGIIATAAEVAAGTYSNWTTNSGGAPTDTITLSNRFNSHITSPPEDAWTDALKRGNSSVVWVFPVTPGDDFEQIWFDDGQGGEHIIVIRDTVEDFTLLPTIGPHKYKVLVDGDPTIEEDNYWVWSEFVSDQDGNTSMEKIRWVETIAPDIEYKYDASTMPHQLVRRQDDDAGTVTGTAGKIYFEFGPAAWTDRLVGDDDTNPWAPFLDSNITGLTFVQNRLGLISGSSITLSEANEFFNIFRTTVRQVPDSDRIIIEPSSQQVARFYAADTIDENLVLSADQAQFVLRGDPAISARSVSMSQTSKYDSLPNVEMANSGQSLFFAAPDSGDTKIMETSPRSGRTAFTVTEASEAVPRYIRGEATDLDATPTGRCLCVLADDDPSKVFVLRWSESGGEKLQWSWFTWQFAGDVVGMEWIEQDLYFMERIQDPDTLWTYSYLNKITLGALLEDGSLPFEVHLDRRSEITGVYDAPTDRTTFTFPYEPTSPAVVTQPDADGAGIYWLEIHDQSGTDVEVRGDWSDYTCWAGELFESRYVFSRPYQRERAVPDGVQSKLSLPTSLVALVLELRDTYSLNVAVEGPYRTDSFKAIRGPEINEAVLGTFTPADGMHRCGVMCDPRSEEVVLTNETPWPARVMGAEWEMRVTSRGSRAPV